MNTAPASELHSVAFGKQEIKFRLKRTGRKTLAITVKPDATVTVTAPHGAGLDTVKAKVAKRALWIKRQQSFFAEYLPPLPPRRYISGETHLYLGRQYRLKVFRDGQAHVKLMGAYLSVHTRAPGDPVRIKSLLEQWYLDHARRRFSLALAAWLPVARRYHLPEPRLAIRRMPNRWGSCTRRRWIYLHPDLIKAPASCLEYVLVHELCHLKYPHHRPEFYDLLRRLLPDWETRKARLERFSFVIFPSESSAQPLA